jgi:hypothetical protein
MSQNRSLFEQLFKETFEIFFLLKYIFLAIREV